MDDRNELYREEETRIAKYESDYVDRTVTEQTAEKQKAPVYRELNTRFLKLESETQHDPQTAQKKKNYQKRKEEIEAAWHQRMHTKASGLLNGSNEDDQKNPDHYDSFELVDMEVLLKHNDRGGNSEEYNNVVTDLELYNGVFDKVKSDPDEQMELLLRIRESCNTYISTRKRPFSTKGKIRKAIIQNISKRIGGEIATLEAQGVSSSVQKKVKASTSQDDSASLTTTTTTTTQAVSKGDVVEKISSKRLEEMYKEALASYRAFQKDPESIPKAELACKAHFELVTIEMRKPGTLASRKRKTLDDQMAAIMKVILDHEKNHVGDDQNDTSSTRFFNAIGWADRKPDIVDETGFEATLRVSEHKRPMYHAINQTDKLNATDLAKQLLGLAPGKSRQYYSNGFMGKGTYFASVNMEHQDRPDKLAVAASWGYGENIGSVQVKACLNSHARINDFVYDYITPRNRAEPMKKAFPNVFKALPVDEMTGDDLYQFYSIVTALMGFNVLYSRDMNRTGCDFYVVLDRSVLTMTGTGEKRLTQGVNRRTIDADKIATEKVDLLG